MTVYNDRFASPTSVTRSVHGRTIGSETSREAPREGVHRELEVTLMMNLQTAKEVRHWLNEHITKLEAESEAAEDDTASEES